MAQSGLRCIVVTPEQTVLDAAAEFVALPLFDGELGVAADHAPMIGRLGFGELRIRAATQTHRYYVDGGFVQVADNLVSVLTNSAEPAQKLDEQAVRERISASLAATVAGDDAIQARDRALAQSRAQLRVAQRAR
ncbi:MAG: ATP synthase F1 subunit epsilon [Planctomycetota bacterium]